MFIYSIDFSWGTGSIGVDSTIFLVLSIFNAKFINKFNFENGKISGRKGHVRKLLPKVLSILLQPDNLHHPSVFQRDYRPSLLHFWLFLSSQAINVVITRRFLICLHNPVRSNVWDCWPCYLQALVSDAAPLPTRQLHVLLSFSCCLRA